MKGIAGQSSSTTSFLSAPSFMSGLATLTIVGGGSLLAVVAPYMAIAPAGTAVTLDGLRAMRAPLAAAARAPERQSRVAGGSPSLAATAASATSAAFRGYGSLGGGAAATGRAAALPRAARMRGRGSAVPPAVLQNARDDARHSSVQVVAPSAGAEVAAAATLSASASLD